VISEALVFATAAHDGQRRRSGEAFIVHPVAVAIICAEFKLDCDTIVAALLHDTVEDTDVTIDDIRGRFGDSVASLVAGVTDSAALPDSLNQRIQLRAMSEDWRICLVKLADRMHNMRTLQHMPRAKQQAKSVDTLSVYVPLARSLGIREIEHELLQQSATYLFPRVCATLTSLNLRKPASPVLGQCARLRWRPALDTLVSHDVTLNGHAARWAAHEAEAYMYNL